MLDLRQWAHLFSLERRQEFEDTFVTSSLSTPFEKSSQSSSSIISTSNSSTAKISCLLVCEISLVPLQVLIDGLLDPSPPLSSMNFASLVVPAEATVGSKDTRA